MATNECLKLLRQDNIDWRAHIDCPFPPASINYNKKWLKLFIDVLDNL